MNPNDLSVVYHTAFVLAYLGERGEALNWLGKALGSGPVFWEPFHEILFDVYYMNRDYEQAIKAMNQWRNPHAFFNACLAAAHAQLGQMEEAKAAATSYETEVPDGYDFPAVAAAHASICRRQEDADQWLEGYRKAGLLE